MSRPCSHLNNSAQSRGMLPVTDEQDEDERKTEAQKISSEISSAL